MVEVVELFEELFASIHHCDSSCDLHQEFEFCSIGLLKSCTEYYLRRRDQWANLPHVALHMSQVENYYLDWTPKFSLIDYSHSKLQILVSPSSSTCPGYDMQY